MVITDRLGCRIRSTPSGSVCICLRTASRIRRLMRLRSCALPSTLPAVRPTRGPVVVEDVCTGVVEEGSRGARNHDIEAENCLRVALYTRWYSACLRNRASRRRAASAGPALENSVGSFESGDREGGVIVSHCRLQQLSRRNLIGTCGRSGTRSRSKRLRLNLAECQTSAWRNSTTRGG